MEYILKTKHSEILDLLKKFQDRKSGKIVESRKILRDSFYFLRRKDKRLVLRAFLNGSKTDMDFASLKMQYRWFPELMPLLKERWLSVQTNKWPSSSYIIQARIMSCRRSFCSSRHWAIINILPRQPLGVRMRSFLLLSIFLITHFQEPNTVGSVSFMEYR